jgi:hypothetical protein
VSIQIRPACRASRSRASRRVARPDNRLSFMDQAAFLSMRATGLGQLMQCVWVYDHAIDLDELRRFHQNFGYGLFGRRIERSPLPFGRHRWVSSLGPPSDIDIAERVRPRTELSDWIDERTQLPVDPEGGPGWHLGVLPLADGSTAISLVLSHCLSDGLGALLAIADAVKGNTRDLGYPPPRSRTRLSAVVSDLRQTAQGTPEVARALAAAVKFAIRRRHDIARSRAPRSTAILGDDGDRRVVVPVITIFIDLDDWDGRAKALGGNNYSLLAGLAAKFGERMGRLSTNDGAATLRIPISYRTEDDTRANAMQFATVSVDPTQVTTDLSGARVAIGQALKTLREVPDETFQLLPLIQLVPDRAVNRVADVFLGSADLPVTCSNLGDIDPAVARPDGTDAEYVMLRGLNQNVTRQDLERAHGQLFLVCGKVGAKLSISVGAYQPGGTNTKPHLRELAARTLAEFGLTCVLIE